MCVTIPLQVMRVEKGRALVEGNRRVILENGLSVTRGDYVTVVGHMATRVLTKKQGKEARAFIRSLIDV